MSDIKEKLAESIRMATAVQQIVTEAHQAVADHKPFNSPHEAYGILKEEVDECWDAIKDDDIEQARKEAIQVGAMAIRFLMDIHAMDFPPKKLKPDLLSKYSGELNGPVTIHMTPGCTLSEPIIELGKES